MSTWKKMAEAFGELAGRNMRRGKNSNVDAWSRNSANKSADTRKAFKEGESLGSDIQGIADELADASEHGETRYNRTSDQFYDQLKEVNQSNRGPGQSLEKDFDKAFEEAAENHGYKKWREESKDMPLDDGFKGDLHDINREDAVQRSREEIIKALQQNTDRDVTDVLRDFGYIFEE